MQLWKRGRTWWCIFYADGVRQRRSTQCRDRTAAESVARQWERAAADPAHATAHAATLANAIHGLLSLRREEVKAGRKSASTVSFYEAKTGHLARVLGDDFPLRRLNAAVVDGYISTRRSDGAGDHTISKELVALRAALKLAARAGQWLGNLTAVMPAAFDPGYKPRERFLTPAEARALINQLPPDHGARVAFILATSARWSESDRAERADLGPTAVVIRGTKTDRSARTVPVAARIQRELLDYAAGNAQGQHALLFRPWTGVRHALERACDRAGIPWCTPNDLRRTFSHWMRAMGAGLEDLAPAMGHASTAMLQRVYARLTTEELRASLMRSLGEDCDTFVPTPLPPVAQMARKAGANLLETVPRDGIEPPARGFSILALGPIAPRTDGKTQADQGGSVTHLWQRKAGG